MKSKRGQLGNQRPLVVPPADLAKARPQPAESPNPLAFESALLFQICRPSIHTNGHELFAKETSGYYVR